MRFELTEPEGSTVFKTAPFDRSGTPPRSSSVAAVATMKDLDKLALAMPEATKEIEDGRPAYNVHGKMFCFHRSRKNDQARRAGND